MMDLLTAVILIVIAWVTLTLLACLWLSLMMSAISTDIINAISWLCQRLTTEIDHVRKEIKVNREMMAKMEDNHD